MLTVRDNIITILLTIDNITNIIYSSQDLLIERENAKMLARQQQMRGGRAASVAQLHTVYSNPTPAMAAILQRIKRRNAMPGSARKHRHMGWVLAFFRQSMVKKIGCVNDGTCRPPPPPSKVSPLKK